MATQQRITKRIKGTIKYDYIDIIDIETGIPWIVFYFKDKEVARKRFESVSSSVMPLTGISITDLKGLLNWELLK